MADQIVFPPYRGLPYDWAPPKVDGFCEWELGLATPEIEAGWDGSARLTFGGASKLPRASFQAVRDDGAGFIYLSFLVRFDWSYDALDGMILVLQPTYSAASHPVGTCRLVIRPINPGVGAGTTVDATYSFTDPDTLITKSVDVRTDKTVNYEVRMWDGAAWVDPGITVSAGGPFDIKARSWGFDADLAQPHDLCWSVELKIPSKKTSAGAFSAQWHDLDPAGFGFYFNLFKFVPEIYTGPGGPGNAIDLKLVIEHYWPDTYTSGGSTQPNSFSDADGTFSALEQIFPGPERMGKALLSGTGQGVSFDYGSSLPIVVKLSGVPGTTLDVTGTQNNEIVANIRNTGTTIAEDVRAQFRIARFGIVGTHQGDWDAFHPSTVVTTATPNQNPTAFTNIAASGGTAHPTVNWTLTPAEKATFAPLEDDNCIACYLDSDKPTVFSESATWQNMTLKKLSHALTQITVNGKNQGPTHDGGPNHDYLLAVVKRLVVSSSPQDGWIPGADGKPGINVAGDPYGGREHRGEFVSYNKQNPKVGKTAAPIGKVIFDQWAQSSQVSSTWVVITVGYLKSPKKLTMGGKTFSLYNLVDTCNQVLTHEGSVERFEHTVQGPGLTPLGDGIYQLPVPANGAVVLETRSEAVGPARDDLLDVLLALLDKLLAVLGRLKGCGDHLDPILTLLRQLGLLVRFLPVPPTTRALLEELLRRVTAIKRSLRVLDELHERLDGLEHAVDALDRILDKLRALDPQQRNGLLEKLFGADAGRIIKMIAALEAEEKRLAELLPLLQRLLRELQKLADLCQGIDAFYALLRGFMRALGKLRTLSAGIEARFPWLDRFLPAADPKGGTFGQQLDALQKGGETLVTISRILEGLDAYERGIEKARAELDALHYEDLAPVADRLYKAAFG